MKIYQAGVSSRRTQQAARIVMEDITREVRTANEIAINDPPNPEKLCLESQRSVLYQRDNQRNLLKTVGTGNCPNIDGAPLKLIDSQGGAVELGELNVDFIEDESGEYVSVKVTLTVTTGAADLLDEDGQACKPGVSGSQFCSTTSYTNVISLR